MKKYLKLISVATKTTLRFLRTDLFSFFRVLWVKTTNPVVAVSWIVSIKGTEKDEKTGMVSAKVGYWGNFAHLVRRHYEETESMTSDCVARLDKYSEEIKMSKYIHASPDLTPCYCSMVAFYTGKEKYSLVSAEKGVYVFQKNLTYRDVQEMCQLLQIPNRNTWHMFNLPPLS